MSVTLARWTHVAPASWSRASWSNSSTPTARGRCLQRAAACGRYLDPPGGDGQVPSMPQAFTSWEAIYETLRASFPNERYHMGATLVGVDDPGDGQAVSAEIEGHGHTKTDLLVCADGAQSPTRRRLLPDVPSTYAGYVAWRGTLDEADAPKELVRFFEDAFTFSEARSGGHILTYFIPGAGADTTLGRRRLNWVWYVAADQ